MKKRIKIRNDWGNVKPATKIIKSKKYKKRIIEKDFKKLHKGEF